MEIDKSVKCAIGESLILAELLKRGHEAYIAHGPTQKGWDIVVISGQSIQRVQVKTIGWPEKDQRTVTVSNSLKFDFLVVVLLNLKQPHSRYLVCTKQEIENLLSAENPDRTNKSRSWYIPQDLNGSEQIISLENAWSKIT
ncbi:hypothetical protein [Pseudomonas sp. BMS12]|uniref:hypothetical protein n=1 Tax=Pseudomonas sp. BMS12 TaxID=1796033 RepID=UPI00129024A5|nr:hypothetical protein [Pseudomonas sp. BMS12]